MGLSFPLAQQLPVRYWSFVAQLFASRTQEAPRGGWWPELFASLLAFSGVIVAILAGFHPLTAQDPATDFKTVYAATACFVHHLDPYNFSNIAAVFNVNHAIRPATWYGHAPVYPPFTLAVLAPLASLPMLTAIYVWLSVSGVALALAAFVLTRAAAGIFALNRFWRMVLIALFASMPVLSFGVELCNVSIVVSALCIIAVALPQRRQADTWLSAAALAFGLLLKPHLALWVVMALLISRTRVDRRIALCAAALAAVFGLGVAAWMAAHHQLLPQLASYRAMVHEEMSGGSMSATNRELATIGAQITSLASLLGYGLSGTSLNVVTALCLLLVFGSLLSLSLRNHYSQATRLTQIAAWSAFGLIATYHRAHDGVILVLAVPYVLARLRENWHDGFAWTALMLAALLGSSLSWDTWHWLATMHGLWHIANFFLYRQAPLAAVLLLLLLLGDMTRVHAARVLTLPHEEPEEELAEAA